MRPLEVWRLGRVEYEDGLSLQHAFSRALAAGLSPDTLLLLEHPPVLTLGRAAERENIVASPAELARVGAEVFDTDRGGDVTYHGPGQVVGYPIFDLGHRQDVRRYIRDLEEAITRTLARFGIAAAHISKWPGVWVRPDGPRPEKIAAIGVHIAHWRTTHGFALNVSTDLAHFGLCVPCGIKEGGVTSMERELGRKVEVTEVETALAESFAEVFGSALSFATSPQQRTVSVAVLRRQGAERRVLLLHRTSERGGFWQLVTGRVERGEEVAAAAARETKEETGRALTVRALGYRHSFALGEGPKPLVCEETAFAAEWEGEQRVRLDGSEHDAFEWVPPDEALARLPFKGLKVAVGLALGPA
ncbi:MAG: lipoyl(octanoyl) transferase LipB [Myxococcaceae bacterium]